MRKIMTTTAALLAALFVVSSQASAQATCRAADITSDGIVSAPDFTELSVCYGRDVSEVVPSGDYVGFLASSQVGLLGRDQACRDSFGLTGHWCTSLEMSKIPDITALPDGALLAVRATPPVSPLLTPDWVTGAQVGVDSEGVVGVKVQRVGSDALFLSGAISGAAGFTCCAEPAP